MKIFISRNLAADSPFREALSADGHEVHGESLVEFSAVPFTTLPEADWLFFYSKKAVSFFFQQVEKTALAKFDIAALGPGTAEYISKLYREPDFTGDGDPGNAAANFLKVAAGRRIIFPRASDSRRSIQQLLGSSIISLDLVVYENVSRPDFNLPGFDVLVFTSPLNTQAYFSKKSWERFQKIVAIGATTAAALASLGIYGVKVAEEPSEEALAKAVQEVVGGL